MREDVFRGVFKNSISGKELRKYNDYAQYPRSALILRVLLLKVRRGGRPQPQARSSVSTWTTQCGAGMRWFSQSWQAPDFRD